MSFNQTKVSKIFWKKVIVAFILGMLIFSMGTIGYSLIEGWSYFDSFYMTVITLGTIGYQEVHPLSQEGRVFTILLIFFGLGIIAYIFDSMLRIIIGGDLAQYLRRRQLENNINKLNGHTIVCGHGRMGRIICNELSRNNVPFVVIEKEPFDYPQTGNCMHIQGDATNEEALLSSGIERAASLITVLSSDVHNLYAVMSARELNPNLHIVARADEESAQRKLLRAGADRVVLPYDIGGYRIANAVLRPAVVDFIEFASHNEGDVDILMEEMKVQADSVLNGKTISKASIGSKLGVIVVAIKGSDGKMNFNPRHNTLINEGDTLIILCEKEQVPAMKELVGVTKS